MDTPDIHWLGHSAFRIRTQKGLEIYFDPFRLAADLPKAGLILITHAHHDHCSPPDIARIYDRNTAIVAPLCTLPALQEAGYSAHPLPPGAAAELKGVKIEAVPSYNTDKRFHPREAGNCGYICTVDGTRIYFAGDTDHIPEMKAFHADIALLPIGGTYTMNAEEAAQAALDMDAPLVIPMHYGSHVGKPEDARELARLRKTGLLILPKE